MIACNFYQEGLRETFHTAPNGELLVGYSRYFTSQFSCRSGRRSSNLMLDWWNAWQREEEGTHFELLLLAPTRKARQRERPDLHFSICTDRETRRCVLSELYAGHCGLLWAVFLHLKDKLRLWLDSNILCVSPGSEQITPVSVSDLGDFY